MLVRSLLGFAGTVNYFHLATTLTRITIPEMQDNKPPNSTTSRDDKAIPIANTTKPMMNMIKNFA